MDIKEKHMKLVDELYRSFDFFNKHFCDNALIRPLITIQHTKPSVLGWYGKKFWSHKEGDAEMQLDEINISAENMHRTSDEVLATLLHEMAHLKNWQADIEDCTQTQYHKNSFKIAAEFFGLNVQKMQGRGYAHTTLGEKAIEAIKLLEVNQDAYCIVRQPPLVPKKPSTTISIPVDIEYAEKINVLLGIFDKKKEMGNAAIELLYNTYINNEEQDEEISE